MVLTEAGAGRPRLSHATLANEVSPDVRRPRPTGDATPSLAHLGVGVFHRAHQAVYTQDLIDAGNGAAREIGVSMRSPVVRDQLAAQDHLFSVTTLDHGEVTECRVIDAIAEMWVLPERPADLVARLSDPSIEVVTITITEAGYHWSAAEQSLDTASPQIRADLAEPAAPRSMPGLLTAVARRRRREGAPPLTVVSCDNLIANGVLTHQVLSEFASLVGSDAPAAVADALVCCSSMVDRMVPAPTDVLLARSSEYLGVEDRAAVVTERFTQWVVERHPDARLPRWDTVGALFVDDVAPYETAKLRVVNATHTALASVGLMRGHRTIAEATSDPTIRQFVDTMVRDETVPSIPRPSPLEIELYVDDVLHRFTDPSLGYTTAKVLSGGADKIPQRLAPILESSLRAGRPIDSTCFVIASWLWTIAGPHPVIDDPLGDWLAGRVGARADADRTIDHLSDTSGPGRRVLGALFDDERVDAELRRAARRVWADPHGPLDRERQTT